MTRYSLIALTLLSIVGCGPKNSGGAGSNEKMTAQAPTPTELAAYAGHATYPSSQQANNDLRAAAVVSPNRDAIKIYNFTAQPLRSVDVWINGAYVQHVAGIPPQGSVTVRSTDLYNGLGKSFASQQEPVSRVQVKTSDGFYNVMGPASE